jgi:hypothetical protein
VNDRTKARPYKPDPRECVLLFLRLIEERQGRRSRGLTQVRLSELTLRHLWNRQLLTEQFLRHIEEWMLGAGWALVRTGRTYGAVKVSVVENWPRVSWKNLRDEISAVHRGDYDFDKIEHLIEVDSEGISNDRGEENPETDDHGDD